MSSKVPTVRLIAWISLIPQLLFWAFLAFIWHQLNTDNPYLYAAITYLFTSFFLRTFVPKNHRKGMICVKSEKFKEAIPYFEKSEAFFKKYAWLDTYRYLTLLSSSKMSYREMALNNIAFCYGQLGNGLKSKEYYEKTLLEFPNSAMAKIGLNLLNSMIPASESKNGNNTHQNN